MYSLNICTFFTSEDEFQLIRGFCLVHRIIRLKGKKMKIKFYQLDLPLEVESLDMLHKCDFVTLEPLITITESLEEGDIILNTLTDDSLYLTVQEVL